jgi:hypothetical protein
MLKAKGYYNSSESPWHFLSWMNLTASLNPDVIAMLLCSFFHPLVGVMVSVEGVESLDFLGVRLLALLNMLNALALMTKWFRGEGLWILLLFLFFIRKRTSVSLVASNSTISSLSVIYIIISGDIYYLLVLGRLIWLLRSAIIYLHCPRSSIHLNQFIIIIGAAIFNWISNLQKF